jgi:hypothetical protein
MKTSLSRKARLKEDTFWSNLKKALKDNTVKVCHK